MPKSSFPSFTPVNGALFREAMSRFATGVTVVTALLDKKPVGVTISSFAGVSLKPPLVLFCLDEKSSVHGAFKTGSYFAVHVLAENQQKIAHTFARAHSAAKKPIFRKHKTGAPIMDGAMEVVLCRLHKKVKAGDHTIIIGRVQEILINARRPVPLLHTQRSYWDLGKKK